MKKKALKEAVVKAMKNYTCSVFSGRNQHECVTLEKEARDYFSDANVLARVLNPQTYFQQFSTVALKEVCLTYVRCCFSTNFNISRRFCGHCLWA